MLSMLQLVVIEHQLDVLIVFGSFVYMMTKHRHCDLIKAWADGESIQYWSPVYKKWIDFEEGQTILWNLEKYRIKPKEILIDEISFKELLDMATNITPSVALSQQLVIEAYVAGKRSVLKDGIRVDDGL